MAAGTNASNRQSSQFLPMYRPSWQHAVISLLIFLVLVCLKHPRAIAALSSKFIGGAERDAGLYIWLVRNNLENLTKLSWFETPAFYPYGQTLAWSDNFILPSIVAWLLGALGLSVVASYNCLLLGAQLLCGYFTCRLTYSLVGKRWQSIVAGLAFMSMSWFSTQLGHPQNQFAFFIPWALFAFFSFVSKPTLLRAIRCGIIVGLAFLTTVYYSIFSLVAILVACGALYLLRPNHLSVRTYLLLLFGMAIGLLLFLPFITPYLQVKAAFGNRGIYEAYHFSANALALVSSGPFNLMYNFSSSWGNAEAYCFPGLLVLIFSWIGFSRLAEAKSAGRIVRAFLGVLALALISSLPILPRPWLGYLCAIFTWIGLILFGVFLRRLGAAEIKLGFTFLTNRGILAIFFAIALVFLALSFGPLGDPSKGQIAPGVFSAAYTLIPGFSAIRAASRALIVTLLCLSIAASFGLSHIIERKRLGPAVSFIVALLIFTENINTTYALEELKGPSAVFDILKFRIHRNDAIVILPLATDLDNNGRVISWSEFARNNVNYMNWTLDIQAKLVNGYSGQRTNLTRDMVKRCAKFPDEMCLRFLSTISGLRFLLYSPGFDPKFNAAEFNDKISRLSSQLSLIAQDDQGNSLYEFRPKTEINNEISLVYPPRSEIGSIELLAATNSKEPIKVEVLQEIDKAKVTLAFISLIANGAWQQFTFPLPKAKSPVLPTRIFIKPELSAYQIKPKILLGSSSAQ